MLTYDQIPALFFVAFVAVVYWLAARNLIVMALGRAGRAKVSSKRSAVYLRRTVFSLALIGLLCFAYGYFVEPYWPEVTHVELRTPKFAGTERTVRIAHISDLHSDPRARLEDRLPSLISEQKPDLILFSGDAVNSPDGIPVFRECLRQIAKIAPTYVVKGNWDLSNSSADLYGNTGVHELTGEAATVDVRGARVWVNGAGVDRASRIPAILAEAPADAFTIFLYHYPDEIYAAADKVDLYSAGHTHGGQVALPFWGALVTLSRYGKRFESGLFKVGQTYLYVNRGVGMEGDLAPRVRFWARPEITIYEIAGT